MSKLVESLSARVHYGGGREWFYRALNSGRGLLPAAKALWRRASACRGTDVGYVSVPFPATEAAARDMALLGWGAISGRR